MLKVIYIFLILRSTLLFAAPANKSSLAIVLNENRPSTSTQNSIEQHARNGASLALTKAKKIHPLWMNQEENAEQTLKTIEELNSKKPSLVIGLTNSLQVLLAAERMHEDIVLLSPTATSDEILKKNKPILLLGNINSLQAALLAKELTLSAKATEKILLIEVAGCPYCMDMSNAIKVNLEKLKFSFDSRTVHFSELPEVPKELAAATGYSHIVIPAHEAESAQIIGALFQKNKAATYWGGDGWGTLGRFIRELPFSRQLKAVWLSHYHPAIRTPENQNFVKSFLRIYGKEPVDTSAFFYEAILIAQKLDLNSPQTILRDFANIKSYRGLTGRVRIQNRNVLRPMPLLQLVEGEVRFAKLLESYASL